MTLFSLYVEIYISCSCFLNRVHHEHENDICWWLRVIFFKRHVSHFGPYVDKPDA